MAVKKDNQGKFEKIATMAAEQAVKKYQEQEKKRKKDYRFRNTKLLLKNYNSLKSYLENALDSIKEIDDIINKDDIDMSTKDELYIQSIRDSKFKTLIMVSHIDAAILQLRKNMVAKEQQDKYLVIEKIYVGNKTFEEVAKELHCDQTTIRRWEKATVDELSVLLFGVDGLKMLI